MSRALRAICYWLILSILAGAPAQCGEPRHVDASQTQATVAFPDLPQAITSFGTATINGTAYLYGGHFGKAHHYYDQGQSGDLLALDLEERGAWKLISTGPRRQGLAMVAHGGKLYRLGGFDARNAVDEEQDLWSVAACDRFDPASGTWQEMPSMPEPRSSFDATVIGDVIYVVGGWSMQGSKEATWLRSALALDLSRDQPRWRSIPDAPFERRALALGHQDGKLLAIGGMQPDGNIALQSAVYDPQSQSWSEGPALEGEAMEGFGAACCHVAGRLILSTSSGKVLRLSQDASRWESIGQLEKARFFHRLLPVKENAVLAIAGASMQTGKFASVEAFDLEQAKPPTEKQ